jgi:small subunit ribosomal protein S13
VARIAGVDLPKDKRIEISLRYIFGIGPTTALRILNEAGIDPATKTKDLTEDAIVKIRAILDRDYVVEGDLRRDITMQIKRLMDTGSYRGLRHRRDEDECPDSEGSKEVRDGRQRKKEELGQEITNRFALTG